MDEVAAGCVCSDNACVLYIEKKDTVSWNTHNYCLEYCTDYRKVVSVNRSWLEAHFRIYKLFMKGKFDFYSLWPFNKKVDFLVSNTC